MITTYATLKTEVASWLVRTDLTDATLSTFVQLAEGDIRNDVRMRANEAAQTGTVASLTISLPANFLELRILVVDGDTYRYVNPEEYTALLDAEIEGVYTIIGDSVHLTSGDGDTYELTYYKSFTAFSSASDTNDLLTKAPHVYLWAACKHGSTFTRDDAGYTLFEMRYRAAVSQLNIIEKQGEYGNSMAVRTA
jgi:hypothetical protein